ncbi:hypothetical protein P153DRAFT_368317 [Dothidotthia symphoricarpi CBS 119687]|uniref:Uncharacterized protein n=1 Tax=Dothidotthia symphoricarpi CBS 119687 TaxID=1392245 RepID=A0A6A6A6W8_9PLEO|nr:uncharacterized protein P153DRAFT_368317 [Dothidotthia symphoricarpi CBS 119687]KAF2127762.1 hypothetical protein P153DRAFT_368317 [Dothidotthia symphoricarpi CBS 119687]
MANVQEKLVLSPDHWHNDTMRSTSVTQERGAEDAVFQKDRIRCAKADCLRFTQMMCRKLPKELRGLVYQYLCVQDQLIPAGPYHHFSVYKPLSSTSSLAYGTGSSQLDPQNPTDVDSGSEYDEIHPQNETILLPDGRVKEDHSNKPASNLLMPYSHIFNPRYVGSKVALEAQEVYYSNNSFSVCNVDNGLEMFLYRDTARVFHICKHQSCSSRHHTGVRPIQFVQDLQIRLKYEHFFNEVTDMTATEMTSREHRLLESLQRSIEVLPEQLKYTPVRDLNIEFILMTELSHPLHGYQTHHLVNSLQAIRNTIYRLMHDHEKTKVTVVHHDELLSPFPRNITGLFSLTREQWDHEKINNAGRHDWTPGYYILPSGVVAHESISGVPHFEADVLLRERWGMHSALDTKSQQLVSEGKYWPKISTE